MDYPIHPSSPTMQNLKKKPRGANKIKYPWVSLSVGSSFAIPFDSGIQHNSIVSLAYKTGRKLGRSFVVVVHEAERVFEVGRVADPVKEVEMKPIPQASVEPVGSIIGTFNEPVVELRSSWDKPLVDTAPMDKMKKGE